MSHRRESNKLDSELELRRGPWTLEEDSLLVHYIALHGEGRWNLLARSSGLKRTGKSCRLRWLNYLKPDVKRGNLSPEEQLLILELHSKWGNRWSRIAQHLPGRTDNEIKNYWRTRVQKQARNLKIDTNSSIFSNLLQSYWMPQLLHKIASTSPSQINPYAIKFETIPGEYVEPLSFPVTMKAPGLFHHDEERLMLGDERSENCIANAELSPTGYAHFSSRLNEMEAKSFMDGEFALDQHVYDEVNLGDAVLSLPAAGANFDGDGYGDFGGFYDSLWN